MWLTAWPSRNLQKPCISALLLIPCFSISFACNFPSVSVGELSGFPMSLCIFSHPWSVLCMSVYVSVHLWFSLCFLCFSLALANVYFLLSSWLFVTQSVYFSVIGSLCSCLWVCISVSISQSLVTLCVSMCLL